MPKMRVYELAKELDLDNKGLIERMEKLGIAVRSHSSTLEEQEVERIRHEFALGVRDTVIEKRVAVGVIRRRAVRQPKEEGLPEEQIEGEEMAPEPAPPEEAAPLAPPGEAEKAVEPEVPSAPAPLEPPREVTEPLAPAAPAGPVAPPPSTPPQRADRDKPWKRRPAAAPGAPERGPRPVAPPPEASKIEPRVVDFTSGDKRKKKPFGAIVEDIPARKKSFIKQRVDKKEKQVVWEQLDQDGRPIKGDRRQAVTEMKKTEITTPKAIKRRIKVEEAILVSELAKRMGVKVSDVIAKLMGLGIMASINQSIDVEAAGLVASEFGYQVEAVNADYEEMIPHVEVLSENEELRAPVVTVMGHVDHGKTSLLDAIRKTNVIEGEAGGITQAIGAYHVTINGKDIVFLDTPGHEAFTSMRARGAQVTDIVVLVVAADDGVMGQTVEAINHAKAADVPIIVAVNKIDKPNADPERVISQLAEYGLVPEAWGGDTIFVRVSAKQKTGIEELLELILLQADILELKADPGAVARGIIIESKLDRGRGPVATVLIQQGTLREGDAVVSKTECGRVRAMIDDKGRRVDQAGPSMPVEVIGFSGVPQAGAEAVVVEDERKARTIAEYWIRKERQRELSGTSKITLEQLYEKIKQGTKEFNVILKADVQGSLEALTESLSKLSTDDVKLNIIHGNTGAVTETDVMLASASDAIIIGFKVRPDTRGSELAAQEGVEIQSYDVIYDAIADVKDAMEGLLEPIFEDVVEGKAVVRELFKVPKLGTIAGSFVTEGKVSRTAHVRLLRDGAMIFDGSMVSLKRFKDDVKEVAQGYECGIGVEGFNDLRVDDIIETYVKRKVERRLQ